MPQRMSLALAILWLGLGMLRAEEPQYPKGSLLAEPAGLAKEDAKAFVILDARERAKYEQGHVPNARWVDHAAWAQAFGAGKDDEGWSKRIGELGIAADARVIVYDDNNAKDAARIWWILRYWGLEDARLLNGGWQGWVSGGLPTEKAEPPAAKAPFPAKAQAKRLATKDELLKSLEKATLQIVDARSEKEFCGVENLTNKRAGAIPGAKQLEWSDLLEKTSHRFKPAAELRKLFEDAGISLDKPTATHCQSGGRASVMAFGLELMGAKDVRNYYASWAEWSSADDTPVTPGKAKEKK
ncbi:MAG: sulfurtransferase [Planctomycetes bacterium]|nr:sulfurtransferase [Planctomycetota bacterium]